MSDPLLGAEKNSSDVYWERVLAPNPEPNRGCIGCWFRTTEGFEGLCVIDRGTGSCRVVELKNHENLIKIVSVERLKAILEPPQPEKEQLPVYLGPPRRGDRVTWAGAPSWWNPDGERLSEIREGYALVEYWRSPIEYARLRVIVKLNFGVQM